MKIGRNGWLTMACQASLASAGWWIMTYAQLGTGTPSRGDFLAMGCMILMTWAFLLRALWLTEDDDYE